MDNETSNLLKRIIVYTKNLSDSEVRIDLVSELGNFLGRNQYTSDDLKTIRIALTLSICSDEAIGLNQTLRDLLRSMECSARVRERLQKESLLLKNTIYIDILNKIKKESLISIYQLQRHFNISVINMLHNLEDLELIKQVDTIEKIYELGTNGYHALNRVLSPTIEP